MNHHPNKKYFFILIPIALVLGLGGIIMFLWNSLMPALLGLKTISFLQAIGLFLLCRILFGSFRFGQRSPSFGASKFKERIMSMSDEERQQWKNEWKQRCNQ